MISASFSSLQKKQTCTLLGKHPVFKQTDIEKNIKNPIFHNLT